LSCQKSGSAVFFSISSIFCFRAAGSKTPPGFLDPGAERLQFRFQFGEHDLPLPASYAFTISRRHFFSFRIVMARVPSTGY
jgi:hypothetical protein